MEFYTSVNRYGNNLAYVGYEHGNRVIRRIPFKPTLYVPSTKGSFKTLSGRRVAEIQPGSMKECREFIDEHTMSNFTICGNTDYPHQYIQQEFPDVIEWDINVIKIAYIDIEVASDQGFPDVEKADKEVTAVCIKTNQSDVFEVWGCGPYDGPSNHNYRKFANEQRLLIDFLKWWNTNIPDVISGWYVEEFDLPYLVNRIERLFGAEALKKFTLFNVPPRKIEATKFSRMKYELMGTSILDYLRLFKKFGYTYGTQENYKLDTIANTVLGEKKLDYSEYGTLNELYIQNHQRFIEYNVKDTGLIERIEEEAGLLSLALTLAYKAKVNYEVTFGSTRIWDTIICNELIKQNIVIEPQKTIVNDRQIEGAYVKHPILGMHNWVASFDLNSLYPHLIMHYNMSPETVGDFIPGFNPDKLLEKSPIDIPNGYCIAANGQTFKIDRQGVFPALVEKMYDERAAIKKKALEAKQKVENGHTEYAARIAVYDNEQMAIKILMNSLYGAMSNRYFRYYNINMAEAITISGQLTIRWAEKYVNEYLQNVLKTDNDYVLAIDTDSIYVCFDELIKKSFGSKSYDDKDATNFIDKVANSKIEPLLIKIFNDLKEYLHAFDQKMVMKREIIAKNVVFTGKKRYIANVINNEGVQYAEPKIKVTGIESVRSSTPKVCRDLINETMKIIMNGTELEVQRFIRKAKEQFKQLNVEDVSFPRGVNNLSNYSIGDDYTKGTPIHVRGCIVYNSLLKKKKLTNKYEIIRDGDKVKFTYLNVPNPTGENVIAYPTVLPKEFGLYNYVDYEKQFEKSYIEPIKHILEVLGWNVEHVSTLENFF